MIELTPEQRRVVIQEEEIPLRVIDPDTQTTYVLLREKEYDQVKMLFTGEEDSQFLQAMYPHVMEVFGKAGWDDPAMDVYDDLDPRCKQSTNNKA